MRAPDGKVQRTYGALASILDDLSIESLVTKQNAAEELFRRLGITLAVYTEGSATERLIPFDLIPRILDRAEWDLIYFQIGEVKYGKPILDRILRRDTSLAAGAKCALISFDSTIRSNVSVGPPIDLMIYRRDTLKPSFTVRLEDDDPYLQAIRERWGGALYKAFHDIVHYPGWLTGPSLTPLERYHRAEHVEG